jgi:hypothetical protein
MIAGKKLIRVSSICVGLFTIFVLGMVDLYAAWIGLELLFGDWWLFGLIFGVILFPFGAVAFTISAYMTATEIWGWQWFWAMIFVSPVPVAMLSGLLWMAIHNHEKDYT